MESRSRRRRSATSAGEAARIATEIGFPVVMKIVSPDILHKTDAGGVMVGREARGGSRAGLRDRSCATRGSTIRGAKVSGVLIQQMLAGGHEVIVGALTDPSFGKVVAFGLGGVLVEVLKDVTFRLAPATEADALSMLDGIAAAEILRGVRGGAAVDRARSGAHHRCGLAVGQRFSRDSRTRSESGFREPGWRDCRRRSNHRRFRAASRTLSPCAGRNPPRDESHHEARRGRRDRRVA